MVTRYLPVDPRKRRALACMVLLLPWAAFAQKPIERTYRFEVAGLDDRDDEKVVLTVVKELAPDALVSLSTALHEAKVRCTCTLAPADLEAGLSPWGLHVVRWIIIGEADLEQRSAAPMLPPDFPVPAASGNGPADQEELRARKLRWYAEHPDHPLTPR